MRTNNKINLSNYNKIYVKYLKTGTLGDTKQLLVNGEEKTTITLGYHIDEFNIIDFNDNVSIGNWYSNDYIIEVWAK